MAVVLVTRPRDGAEATVAGLRALGHEGILAPLLRIAMLRPTLPGPAAFDALVVASRHAVDGVPDAYAILPVFAVGHATASHARRRFGAVHSAGGDAAALASLVAAHRASLGGGRLLLATARREGHALADRLAGLGFTVQRRAVYAQRPVARLPEPARAALAAGRLTHALFFSARTAATFAALLAVEDARATDVRRIVAVTIGPAAAVALASLPWRDLRVAAQPTQEEMLALLS